MNGYSLLDPMLSIKIADFGLINDNIRGSVLYTAPEVYESSNYNSLIDVYSYGCILCFMFSDEPIVKRQDFQVVITNLNNKKRTKEWVKHIELCRDIESKRPNVNEIIKFIIDWVIKKIIKGNSFLFRNKAKELYKSRKFKENSLCKLLNKNSKK